MMLSKVIPLIFLLTFVLSVTILLALMPYTFKFAGKDYAVNGDIPAGFMEWKTPCENVSYVNEKYKILYRDFYLYDEDKRAWNVEITYFESKKDGSQYLIGLYFADNKMNGKEMDVSIRYYLDKEFVEKGKPSYQLNEVSDIIYQGSETWNHFIGMMDGR